jgi:tripartite ATP-independent transporter DctP family solute receptor
MKKKSKMKTLLSVLLILVMVAAVTACGSDDADDKDAAAEPEYVLRVASTVQDDSPGGSVLLDIFEPKIEELSGGRIEVEVYNNSVLGGDRELYEMLQLGTLEVSLGPLSVLANFEPKMGASDLPFLYDSKETAYAALDGDWGAMLAEDLPDTSGMRIICYAENAFRNLSNSIRPIEKLEDMNGIKFRVMESEIYMETFKALGSNPTPIAFSELYTALQNGTVDGQDNGIGLTYLSKLFEVQKYYTISEQQYAAAAVVVAEEWWQALPEDLQKIVEEVSIECRDEQRVRDVTAEEEYLTLMEDSGLLVNKLSAEEKDRFRDACMAVWDSFEDDFGKDIMDAAKNVNDKYGK